MKLSIFLDSDVILDLVLKREEYINSLHIFSLAEKQKIMLFTSTLVIANVHYILSKSIKTSNPKDIIKDLMALVTILSFEPDSVDYALSSESKDFEDCIQFFIADKYKMDMLVTRNIRDYKSLPIKTHTPQEFLSIYKFQ